MKSQKDRKLSSTWKLESEKRIDIIHNGVAEGSKGWLRMRETIRRQ